MKNTFDGLYLYFSENYLTLERTKKECDLIEQLCRLKKGEHIVDIGCGHGRISNELASRGYRVTGIDWCQSALDLASEHARADELEVCYENKNFLKRVWTDEFDCALSWYTSFGYTDDEDCQSQLREIYASLKKGGRFLIDHINRDRCLRSLPASQVQERDENFMIDHFTYDACNGRLQIRRRFFNNGTITEAPYSIRLLPFTEIKGWMSQAGFQNIEGYNIKGQPFRIDGERMILTGVK
jgi:cyclopropane fatty-acyl-phospholipid synthase-like methyltransferase